MTDDTRSTPGAPEQRARLVYRTIETFGWLIHWRSPNPIPDDAWPIDIIRRAIEAAQADALARGLERAAEIAEGGSFLHADAPAARFGRDCAAAIRREITHP